MACCALRHFDLQSLQLVAKGITLPLNGTTPRARHGTRLRVADRRELLLCANASSGFSLQGACTTVSAAVRCNARQRYFRNDAERV